MKNEINKRKKSYTLRKVEDNLSGMSNNITQGSDVGTNPFPFTQEDHKSNEQYHFRTIKDNSPL